MTYTDLFAKGKSITLRQECMKRAIEAGEPDLNS